MAIVSDNFRTALATYPDTQAITNYKKIMMDMLHLNFPSLSEAELAAAIDYSISNHFKDTDITIDNNYKKININMTLRELADYIIHKEPIITSYGVLFNRHGVLPNPIFSMIHRFIIDRKKMKGQMFKYPKGSEMFEKFNLLQLLLKLDANALAYSSALHSRECRLN